MMSSLSWEGFETLRPQETSTPAGGNRPETHPVTGASARRHFRLSACSVDVGGLEEIDGEMDRARDGGEPSRHLTLPRAAPATEIAVRARCGC